MSLDTSVQFRLYSVSVLLSLVSATPISASMRGYFRSECCTAGESPHVSCSLAPMNAEAAQAGSTALQVFRYMTRPGIEPKLPALVAARAQSTGQFDRFIRYFQ